MVAEMIAALAQPSPKIDANEISEFDRQQVRERALAGIGILRGPIEPEGGFRIGPVEAGLACRRDPFERPPMVRPEPGGKPQILERDWPAASEGIPQHGIDQRVVPPLGALIST
jgi:hypothetical protein